MPTAACNQAASSADTPAAPRPVRFPYPTARHRPPSADLPARPLSLSPHNAALPHSALAPPQSRLTRSDAPVLSPACRVALCTPTPHPRATSLYPLSDRADCPPLRCIRPARTVRRSALRRLDSLDQDPNHRYTPLLPLRALSTLRVHRSRKL